MSSWTHRVTHDICLTHYSYCRIRVNSHFGLNALESLISQTVRPYGLGATGAVVRCWAQRCGLHLLRVLIHCAKATTTSSARVAKLTKLTMTSLAWYQLGIWGGPVKLFALFSIANNGSISRDWLLLRGCLRPYCCNHILQKPKHG